jgi:ceramide glucosyltransferase
VNAVATIFFALGTAGAIYLALANLRVIAFARRPAPQPLERSPSITILKPVAGLEPDLAENLESFCRQEYPDYDVVFCLHGGDDPARPVVENVARYAPGTVRISIGEDETIRNPKIANIAAAAASARGDLIVIADSDIRVDPNYLRSIAAAFDSERIGAVTCLYGALPVPGVIAQVGAGHIEDEFSPSVLVALAFGKLRFCLGATMAVRRDVLAAIGGIGAIGSYLADDHALGRYVTQHGYDVALSRYVVHTTVSETRFSQLWSHERRWARTNLTLAPAGYIFSFVMYAPPLALLYLILSQNLTWGIPLLAITVALRLSLHYVARHAFAATHPSMPWLIPVRDCLSLAEWAASLVNRTVHWREDHINANLDGRI